MSLSEELAMELNTSLLMVLPVDPSIEFYSTANDTGSQNNTSYFPEHHAYTPLIVASIIIFPIIVFGMVGNGIVIWILGCRIKRNPFTTYILNLSVADFAFLTVLVPGIIHTHVYILDYAHYTHVLELLVRNLILFTFSASQFLLVAISMDRCICLFFPLWHKCHRPPRLSTIVCIVIWILTFSLSTIAFAIDYSTGYDFWYYLFLLNAVLCLPTMAICTISMVIKICFMSPHHKRGKFLKAVLLALLFFFLFVFPLNVSQLLLWYSISPYFYLVPWICAAVNSAVNPTIYFLVGRKKNPPSKERITKILEKLFQEEETSSREEVESSCKTSL